MYMNKYNIYRALIVVGGVIAVAVAIITNIPIIALAAVVATVLLAIILERSNKEIVRDERVAQIRGKTANIAFFSMLILAGVMSLVTALFRNQLPESIVFAGSILGYSICASLLIYMCIYIVLSRKL
jgi:uncharacterized membrane protein